MNVYVQCRTLPFDQGVVVDDVYVSIHPTGGGLPLAAGYTGQGGNPAGTVFLGNLAAAVYEIHITPAIPAVISEGSQQEITVAAAIDNQVFDVLMTVTALDTATDPHLCRCSGTFVDLYGRPFSDLVLRFSEEEVPDLLYYSGNTRTKAVIPKSLYVRTDDDGFASVDLVRDACYHVYMEGYEHLSRVVQAPVLSSSNLPDVVFPTTYAVVYTAVGGPLDEDAPAVTLAAGATVDLDVETVFRSGQRSVGFVEIVRAVLDGTIASVDELGSGVIRVTGIAVGSTQMTVAREEPATGYGILMAAQPALKGSLSVTVT